MCALAMGAPVTPRPPRNMDANIRPTTLWGGVSWESRFEVGGGVRREEEDRANREPQTSHLHREQCAGEAERERGVNGGKAIAAGLCCLGRS